MPGSDSITVLVPALNEETGLAEAVTTMTAALADSFSEYEILIFDDGSTDATGRIADELAAANPAVTAIHHKTPHGLGGVIREGWQRARMQSVMWVDGQGVTSREALDRIFAERGKADLIVPYASNQHERALLRRIIARMFVGWMNFVFRLDLHQYTHLVVCPSAIARGLRLRSSSHALQAEALVKMIKSGCSYVQVGVEDRFNLPGRRSKAFKIANVIGVVSAMLLTVWDVYAGRDYLKSASGQPAVGSRHRTRVL